MSDVDLTARASFSEWTMATIRYGDQDPLGHVNNAVFSTFMEQGRTTFLYPFLKAIGDPNIDIVLVRITIDYRQELTFPGSVDIGTNVIRLGTKSVTFGHSVFKGGTDECATTGEAVLVFFDLTTRKSILPPSDVRARLEELLKG